MLVINKQLAGKQIKQKEKGEGGQSEFVLSELFNCQARVPSRMPPSCACVCRLCRLSARLPGVTAAVSVHSTGAPLAYHGGPRIIN